MRVIIPAAGKGTRLSTLPDAPPKAMYRIGGKPLLEIVLEQTSFIRPEDTWIVVGYKQEEVRSYFGNSMHYAEQKEQLGTGHAVMMCAEDFRDYDGTVMVTFGDMPLFRGECMKAMCAFHESRHAACTLLTARNPELTMWARTIRDAQGRFTRIRDRAGLLRQFPPERRRFIRQEIKRVRADRADIPFETWCQAALNAAAL